MRPASPRRKTFVVDDEEQIADVLSFALRDRGFDVETFYDARSALLRAIDCSPDILVSDIEMPEMNGVSLAKELQRRIPNCKVILMSGNPEWKIRADWDGNGLNGFAFLPKPFPPGQLLRLIYAEES